jgi:alkanesulfonate monooxygenase SsuD/methylene tetrahydromethanopterin reductase-like flavin-dependent oxidoreductase (luciferase family)
MHKTASLEGLPRIGFSLGPLLSIGQVLEFARLADQKQNVDSLWIPESWGREAYSTLGALTQATTRVRLGTSIINIYSRTPATVAMAAITLDALSGNRTILGLGSSTPAIVNNWHGQRFENPIGRMKEYIEVLRIMLSGQRVNYDGIYFKVKGFKILHDPPRKNVPILVAAVNKKMLNLASSLADGTLLYLRPFEEMKRTVKVIQSSIKKNSAIGRRFEIITIFITSVSNKEPEKARERAAKTLAFYVAVGEYYNRFLSANGFKNEVEIITEGYRKNGLDSIDKLVPDKMLNSLAIYGTSEECAKSVKKFLSTGITMPVLQVNPAPDSEGSIREMLSTF